MKACTKCGELKPLTDFYKLSTGAMGVTGRCKPCYNQAARERYASVPSINSKLIKRTRPKIEGLGRNGRYMDGQTGIPFVSIKNLMQVSRACDKWLRARGIEAEPSVWR